MDRLVVFGARGDLMRRYLAPALAELEAAGALPDALSVTGVGRHALSDADFRALIAEALERHASAASPQARDRLLQRLRYVEGDAADPAAVARATEPDRGPFVAYLALPPTLFGAAAAALAEAGFPAGAQLVVEKPFGHDLDSARALNAALHRKVPERSVYRIDHFLGMQTVQNLLGLRFSNRMFEPLWNRHHVERVDIVWDETLTVEGRGFYDDVGAVRDAVQNHLVQLLCLIAMEPPASLDPRELRDRKVALLRAVAPPDPAAVAERSVRARYTAGAIDERAVPAYTDDEGVDPARATETFAELELRIDNERWRGVPMLLRTGKALGRGRKEIVVAFRPVRDGAFAGAQGVANRLRIGLDPARLALAVAINAPGTHSDVEAVELDRTLATGSLSAYGRVLLGALDGDHTLSIRDDEIEQSWAVVDPFLRAWADGAVPLQEYAAGTAGPEQTLLDEVSTRRRDPSGDAD